MKKLILGLVYFGLMVGCVTSSPAPVKEDQTYDAIPAAYQPTGKDIKQVPYGFYCCDGMGVRRCVMPVAAPIGTGCFCNGQGYGLTCL
ncbi:MAG TPA: hypothetical protein VM577_09480 [Anaerovoracaceae bacterium]|nr:hypothetical protein [Anaerovoracaceae bacterium]